MWRIRVEPDGVQLEANPGESLLKALTREAPGMVPVGCRGGGCGVCRIRVRSGQVTQGAVSVTALPPADRKTGMVLACKATPLTDLVLERL
jgi:ferredoxin